MPAIDAAKGLSESISALTQDQLIQVFQSQGISRKQAQQWAQPLKLRSEALANSLDCYGDFIIPALLMLILQQSLFGGSAAASAGFGSKFHTCGSTRTACAVILGRGIPYFILYAGYALAFFFIHYRIWHIPFSGSILILTTFVGLHVLVVILSGFILGTFFKSRLCALLIALFSSYPLFLLSGIAWPPSSMPLYLQVIRLLFPSTYFFNSALLISRMQATWSDEYRAFAALLIMACVLFAALVVRLRLQSLRHWRIL